MSAGASCVARAWPELVLLHAGCGARSPHPAHRHRTQRNQPTATQPTILQPANGQSVHPAWRAAERTSCSASHTAVARSSSLPAPGECRGWRTHQPHQQSTRTGKQRPFLSPRPSTRSHPCILAPFAVRAATPRRADANNPAAKHSISSASSPSRAATALARCWRCCLRRRRARRRCTSCGCPCRRPRTWGCAWRTSAAAAPPAARAARSARRRAPGAAGGRG